jgi:hypothetical protein
MLDEWRGVGGTYERRGRFKASLLPRSEVRRGKERSG